MGEHLFERYDLLLRQMAPVIHQNVNGTDLLPKPLPKFGIRLVTDKDLCAIVFIGFASRFNVDSINPAAGAKIFFPHVETSAAINSYFDHMHLAANELAKVAMIDFKIMGPLPDASARLMGIEVFAER